MTVSHRRKSDDTLWYIKPENGRRRVVKPDGTEGGLYDTVADARYGIDNGDEDN